MPSCETIEGIRPITVLRHGKNGVPGIANLLRKLIEHEHSSYGQLGRLKAQGHPARVTRRIDSTASETCNFGGKIANIGLIVRRGTECAGIGTRGLAGYRNF